MKNKLFSTTGLQLLISAINFFSGILLASFFGASAEMDAYVVVLGVVVLLNSLFTTAQSKGLIPYLSSVERGMENKAISSILYFNIVLFSVIIVSTYLGSGVLVFLLAPGLDPEQAILASKLLKITASFQLLNGLLGFIQALLEYKGKPLYSLLLGLVRAVTAITLLWCLYSYLGIYSVPYSQFGAVGLVVIIGFVFMLKNGFLLEFKNIDWKIHVAGYFPIVLPVILGQVLLWLIRLSDTFLASFLDEGALSHISYSLRIVTNTGLLFSGFSMIYFPILSKLADNKEFLLVFYKGIKTLFLISLSLVVFLYLFSNEIISVLFERGTFSNSDTNVVASLLRAYSFVIFGAPVVTYLSNAYYSRKKSKIITFYLVVSSVFNVFLNVVLIKVFGVIGIGIASSIAYFISSLLLTYGMKKIVGEFRIGFYLRQLFKSVCVVTPAAGIVYLVKSYGLLSALGSLFSVSIELIVYFVFILVMSYFLKYDFAVNLVKRLKLRS